MVVKPVRLTMRPVIIEPAPMPNISGSSIESGLGGGGAAHDAQVDGQEGDQRHERGAMAGGERVAAPDGGLAQQRDRQQREGRTPFLADEGDERGKAERHQGHERGQAVGAHALRLLEGQ